VQCRKNRTFKKSIGSCIKSDKYKPYKKMKIIHHFYNYITFSLDSTDEEKSKVFWLIKMRWFFLFVQFALIIPWIVFNWPIKMKFILYVGCCFLLIVFNLFSKQILNHYRGKISAYFTLTSLVFDLFILSGLISFVITRIPLPLENLFFINVVLATNLLNNRLSFTYYLMCAFFLGAIQYSHLNYFVNQFSRVTPFFHQFLLFLFWMLSLSVSRYIVKQKKIISDFQMSIEKSNRLKTIGALTAGFSHELASPLNAIKLNLERMNRKKEYTQEAIDSMIYSVEKCQKVIEKINFSQLDNSDYLFQEVRIQDFTRSIIDSWKKEKNANVSLLAEGRFLESYELPVMNFTQMLITLLDNSYEASRGECEIQCRLEDDGKNLIFYMKDNGMGFSEKILENLGRPFISNKVTGVGLGLYTTINFIKALGGEIIFKNDLQNKGALVEISIPQKELV